MRLDAWIREATGRLEAAGCDAAALEAQVLASHGLEVERAWVLAHPEAEAPPALDALLDRRVAGEPLAYILGYREFFGRLFRVRPGVLIPRQDTEVLVEAALARISSSRPVRVLDVGVGSGAIAVTIALERLQAVVEATDLSLDALGVAGANAARLGATMRLIPADVFPSVRCAPYDLIVSNPPYVAEGDAVGPGVEHEPREALYAGADGLDIYRQLCVEGVAWLAPGGAMLLEIGEGQRAAVAALFEEQGWRLEKVRQDLAGIERVIEFERDVAARALSPQ